MTIRQATVVSSETLGWGYAHRPPVGHRMRLNRRTGEVQTNISRDTKPRWVTNENISIDPMTQRIRFKQNGIWVNSALRKDEWEKLDDVIVETAGPRTAVFENIPKADHDSIGVLTHQYNTVSQVTEADVTMTGRSAGTTDAADFNLNGVPLPVIFKEINYGERYLQSSRLEGGSGIDVTQITEATRVVVEKMADLLYNGTTAINLNGDVIYGLTTHPNINTGSASGDFGTISNIYPTILAMISAETADNYHGPFEVDISATQYIEATDVYTATGETAIQRILNHPSITAVNPNDQIAAGGLILRETGAHILEWAQVRMGGQTVNGLEISLVEWMSGDGMVHHFKVMAVGAPIVKSDYATQSGIAYYTGA